MSQASVLVPHRTQPFRLSRAKGGGVTHFVVPETILWTAATLAIASANRDHYAPWVIETPIVIDQLAAEITVASGTNFRIGFYAADLDLKPIGAPLADSGNLSSASIGIKTYTPSTPIFIPPGRYLSVINCDGTPTIRTYRGARHQGFGVDPNDFNSYISYQYVSRTYAAFPTPGTPWDTAANETAGGHHFVVYRLR